MPSLEDRVDYILGKHLKTAFEEIDEALKLYSGHNRTDVWHILETRGGLTDDFNDWENEQ